MVQYLTVETRDLDGFDGLQQAVKGTHFDIVQLGRGKLHGRISYLGIGDLTLSLNSFSVGVCAQRTNDDDKILIGMLLSAADRVTQWSFDMVPGDVVAIPPLSEHHAAHRGASSYAVIQLDPRELPALFADEPRLADQENWQDKNRYRANSDIGMISARRLSLLADQLASLQGTLSDEVTRFLKRTVIECMTVPIRGSLPSYESNHLPSAAKLVRRVEDYLEITGDRPLHISELCSELHLSRRSLHRAFHEIFGIGPVTFLRQKRLCTAYSMLKASAPTETTVAEVAIQQGFVELGRFSHDYHLTFGEYPSQTLAGHAGSAALPFNIAMVAAAASAQLH
jgi:AraC-like DNA-binding protein